MDGSLVRVSLIQRIVSFFQRLRRKRPDASQFEIYSVFMNYYEYMDEADPCYESVKQAARLCDEAIRVARQRIVLASKLKELEEELTELECYNNMTDEEVTYLKNLLDRFLSLQTERNNLMYQLMEFDSSLARMYQLEEQAETVMPELQDAEKSQRILRHDLSYLQGEKADLEYERETLENGLIFIKRFTVAAVVAFVLVTMLLGYLNIFTGMNIFLPTAVLSVVLIAVVSLLYMFKRRMTFELQLNLKKQNRAVELINKKNVVFAYYTNFMGFVYKKYKVRNAQMLKNNLKDFNRYKYVASRLDNIREIMYETNDEIEKILRTKKIVMKSSVEQFAKTISVEDKKRYFIELSARKQSTNRELTRLDDKHESIWDTLVDLNDGDQSEEGIIGQVIQTYLEEVSKLFTIGDDYLETNGEELQPEY